MSIRESNAARWDTRIARARVLAAGGDATRDILDFYARLAEQQRAIAERARPRALTGVMLPAGPRDGCSTPGAGSHVPPSTAFASTIDVEAAADEVPDFLVWLEAAAPSHLRGMATAVRDEQPDWLELMCESLAEDGHDPENAAFAFVVEAVLQPCLEVAASAGGLETRVLHELGKSGPRCPVCCGRPLVGALREDGHGARRFLVCARCLVEWPYHRVVCAVCGEQQFDSLPVFTADAFPHARIEACDTCRHYLKTIDLTKDGLAVPLVDDLATVTLDLWAQGEGYRRLRGNLLKTTMGDSR
jgi:FdhE protein